MIVGTLPRGARALNPNKTPISTKKQEHIDDFKDELENFIIYLVGLFFKNQGTLC